VRLNAAVGGEVNAQTGRTIRAADAAQLLEAATPIPSGLGVRSS
jgi:hypothetical protein